MWLRGMGVVEPLEMRWVNLPARKTVSPATRTSVTLRASPTWLGSVTDGLVASHIDAGALLARAASAGRCTANGTAEATAAASARAAGRRQPSSAPLPLVD